MSIATLPQDSLEKGELNTWVTVPVTVNANGEGTGSYMVQSWDEDEMSFRNSKYVVFDAISRKVDTNYINDTGKTIFLTVTFSYIRWSSIGGQIWIDDVLIIQHYDRNADGREGNGDIYCGPVCIQAIIPPGAKYKVIGPGGSYNMLWAELR